MGIRADHAVFVIPPSASLGLTLSIQSAQNHAMNRRIILAVVLVLVDIPLFMLMFRALFRGTRARNGEGASGAQRDGGSLPRPSEFLDAGFLKDRGGETKLMLFIISAILLVLVEYSIVISLFPALIGP